MSCGANRCRVSCQNGKARQQNPVSGVTDLSLTGELAFVGSGSNETGQEVFDQAKDNPGWRPPCAGQIEERLRVKGWIEAVDKKNIFDFSLDPTDAAVDLQPTGNVPISPTS